MWLALRFWMFLLAVAVSASASAQLLPELDTLEDNAEARGAVLGNPDGDTVLYEFFDYNCGYCRRTYPFLLELTERYPELKVVLVDAPILSEDSIEASYVFMQFPPGELVEAHDTVMRGGRATAERALAIADEAGLEVHRNEGRPSVEDPIWRELAQNRGMFQMLGFSGVPAIFVNDTLIGGYDEAAVEKAVCGWQAPGDCEAFEPLLDDARRRSDAGALDGEVQDYLHRAAALVPEEGRASKLNSVCWRGGGLDQAEAVLGYCEQAVDADPDNFSILDSRARALALTGDYERALADWRRWLEEAERLGNLGKDNAKARLEIVALIESDDRSGLRELLLAL